MTAAVVIGAGPYGLAIAAHLKFLGVDCRIFGQPMHRWMRQMPRQMLLKSEGCASNIADPRGAFTLANFCKVRGLKYSDYIEPISRDRFVQYGMLFQKELVPYLEEMLVTNIRSLDGIRQHTGFELTLPNGETIWAGKVIIAAGMEPYIPPQLTKLSSSLRSHSANHHDLRSFKDKHVVVIGGGQSALETAAILQEDGARVTLVARRSKLYWNRTPIKEHRNLYKRLRYPRTRLGDGLKLALYDKAPDVFHHLPRQMRFDMVRTSLGPAGAWWLKNRVKGVRMLLGHHVTDSGERAIMIQTDDGDGGTLPADHFIAATGYRFDVDNLWFLNADLKLQIRREAESPVLSANFESSVPGLYFAGLASAHAFGPVMRFVAGTEFSARRISSHIAQTYGVVRRFGQATKCHEV